MKLGQLLPGVCLAYDTGAPPQDEENTTDSHLTPGATNTDVH